MTTWVEFTRQVEILCKRYRLSRPDDDWVDYLWVSVEKWPDETFKAVCKEVIKTQKELPKVWKFKELWRKHGTHKDILHRETKEENHL